MRDIDKAIIVMVILAAGLIGTLVHYNGTNKQYEKSLQQDITLETNLKQDFQALMDVTGGICHPGAACTQSPVDCSAFKSSEDVQQCQLTEQAIKAGG